MGRPIYILSLFLLSFFAFSKPVYSIKLPENPGPDSAKFFLLILKEGKVMGKMVSETNKEIEIRGFNGLNHTIPKSQIKEKTELKKFQFLSVKTNDNLEISGTIESVSSSGIKLKSKGGIITSIPAEKISDINTTATSGSGFFVEDPHNMYYFLTKNALPLRKREWRAESHYFVTVNVDYGLTDNITIGGGTITILPYLSSRINHSFSETFHVSAGGAIGYFSSSAFGYGYGVMTIGDQNHNFSFGSAWGFVEDITSKTPLVMLSGMFRIGPKASFITENFFLPSNEYDFKLFSGGIRVQLRKTVLDFGVFILPIEDFITIPLPMITLRTNF